MGGHLGGVSTSDFHIDGVWYMRSSQELRERLADVVRLAQGPGIALAMAERTQASTHWSGSLKGRLNRVGKAGTAAMIHGGKSACCRMYYQAARLQRL